MTTMFENTPPLCSGNNAWISLQLMIYSMTRPGIWKRRWNTILYNNMQTNIKFRMPCTWFTVHTYPVFISSIAYLPCPAAPATCQYWLHPWKKGRQTCYNRHSYITPELNNFQWKITICTPKITICTPKITICTPKITICTPKIVQNLLHLKSIVASFH